MAVCQVCGKSKQYGHNVSHSKRRTKRVFKPNVFRKRMLVLAGNSNTENIKRIKICSKCLKRAKKFGEIKAAKEAELYSSVVSLVDWENIAKEKKGKKADEKKGVGEEKAKEDKKETEVSIEDLVGRKK